MEAVAYVLDQDLEQSGALHAKTTMVTLYALFEILAGYASIAGSNETPRKNGGGGGVLVDVGFVEEIWIWFKY